MPKHAITIDVLGCSLPISAEEEPEYLKNLLEMYRQKVEEIQKTTGIKDPLKIAVLTGFILCDEWEKARNEKLLSIKSGQKTNENPDGAKESTEAEKLTLGLISKLGDILGISAAEEIRAEPDDVYKLENTIKEHDWGSVDLIPGLMDRENTAKTTWAELWMGIHHEGPSKVITGGSVMGEKVPELPLSSLISKDPVYFMGADTETFDNLPFLFKVLAAGKPLSIQVHPSLEQAREGWERENREGIPLHSPVRNYKDAMHKPEIICALTDFTAMAGFRSPQEISRNLSRLLEGAPRDLKIAFFPLLNALDEKEPLKSFLIALFKLPRKTSEALDAFVREAAKTSGEWNLLADFAELFPGDPAIIAPLYLNTLKLLPGDAIFLPAGIMHAYVSGLGVELMANSDNVLRGGMTTKHIDLPELFRIVDFKPFNPQIIHENITQSGIFRYPAPSCREFSLTVIKSMDGNYSETGPSIVLVTRGEVKIAGPKGELFLKKGESAFIPGNHGELRFSGNYTLYAAGTGLR